MKKILIFFLLIASLTANATKVYVATTGNDTSGDGTSGTPYLTIAKGVSEASAGDTVYVVAGTYNISSTIILPVGVSLMGAGDTTIISSTYVGGLTMGTLQLSSAVEGTDGDQSISYIKMEGNVTGLVGIVVYRRSNVKIHHVTIQNFVQEGIKFHGGSGYSDEPTTYATSNEVYNSYFYSTDDGHGAIHLNGQDGIKIHDNIFTSTQRALGHDLGHIDMVEGFVKNIEIYNNTFTLPELLYDTDGTSLLNNFHIEIWDGMGGNRVYNNTFNGGHVGIDVGGHFNVKGSATYSWQIYGNTFQWDAIIPYITNDFSGITIEGSVEYLFIYKNHFKNIPIGINSSMMQINLTHEYIFIYYNIFENIGFSSSGYNFVIRINQGLVSAITRYVYILNNVIDGASTYQRMGIGMESTGAMSYIYIRNNIIKDIVSYGAIVYWDDAGTIDQITITNNDLYNNVNERYYRNGKVVTNETYSDNITTDPAFVGGGDYHLQAGSPCINAGIATELSFITTDYEGDAISDPPEIGAYEY